MAKVKRNRPNPQQAAKVRHSPYTKDSKLPKTQQKNTPQTKDIKPTIPFDPHDRILLIGEGDFSFAHSIVSHHGCADVLATCFDSEEQLSHKYAQATDHISYLLSESQQVLYYVDATKLSQKEIHKGDRWDRIIFNFPHVGGKSTDVNRQVRYNQELLVSFFRASLPLLSPVGTIIVTLFEGEPYTLWNIRDLARHVGLQLERSFKFQAEAYPEYKHARTLGDIEGGGGWKGEQRSARTYVFAAKDLRRKQDTVHKHNGGSQTNKGKAEDSSSDNEA